MALPTGLDVTHWVSYQTGAIGMVLRGLPVVPFLSFTRLRLMLSGLKCQQKDTRETIASPMHFWQAWPPVNVGTSYTFP